MPMGFDTDELRKLDSIVAVRKKVKQGGLLFGNGDPFTSLYAIRTGFFKTCVSSEDGREQVTGFQMAGEIIGLDGIVTDHHNCNAVALEDAEAVSYTHLDVYKRQIHGSSVLALVKSSNLRYSAGRPNPSTLLPPSPDGVFFIGV